MIKDIPVLALTPGEPAGIGPECTIRLAHEHPELRLLAVADPQLLVSAAEIINGYPLIEKPNERMHLDLSATNQPLVNNELFTEKVYKLVDDIIEEQESGSGV